MITEQSLAIQTRERLNLPPSEIPRLMTYIPTALNLLARDVASDPVRRYLLVTNKTNVTSTITGANSRYYSDLSTVIGIYGVMIDQLRFGTIYYSLTAKTFTNLDVNTGNNRITVTDHNFLPGTRIWLTASGSLPSPLTVLTDYYVLVVGASTISLCLTYADAIAETNPVDLTTTGSGTNTITPQNYEVVQLLSSPNIGSFESSLPINYIYGWRDRNLLYISGAVSGTLSYAVPFQPTLDNFATDGSLAQLEADLLDKMVQVAISAGYEPKQESEA